MKITNKMTARMLAGTVVMLLPMAAHAAMDNEGVYVPAPGQETYLGTTRTIAQGTDGTIVERTTTAYPAVTSYGDSYGTTEVAPTAIIPVAPAQQFDALAPATAGVPYASTSSVNDELLEEHQVGQVRYVTGGIGEAERRAMEILRPNYNLRVTNAEKGGAFISDTVVSLWSEKGEELLTTAADPIFFANLPAGRYTVKAEHNGQVKTQKVTIAKGKSAQVQFGWL